MTVEARLVDLERKLERSTRANSQKLEEVKTRLETAEQRLEMKLDRIQSLLEHFEAKELSLNTNFY